MKSKIILISTMLLILFVTDSCEKVGPAGPEGPAGSALTGSLVGFITLYDEFGNLVADKSGVIVSIDGYLPATSSTTNSAGRYEIDDLPTGTYDLIFSKTGYATYKSLSLSFVGGVKPRVFNAILVQQTTTLISSLTLSVYSSTQMTISCTLSPAIPSGYARYLRFFFSKSSSISGTNYLTTLSTGSSSTSLSTIRTFDKVTYPSGTTLYAIAFGESYYTYGYQDLISGLQVYSTISTTGSNIASIIVP
jgi:hypothetical protein